ncbi:hypothetical protein K435DRAFT_361785 [Dendrothele bispora CBS 962.96]|uniref:Uncharacterized protein n=1 Tax=Dendrothele bispora (strain CBS 962.96) TaxID=1314807 RepID=A0A4S8MIL9_DENBC|nr:hypothetical protein K435DRAFT_361785 [Dendrothele bispora CBS 962.96]
MESFDDTTNPTTLSQHLPSSLTPRLSPGLFVKSARELTPGSSYPRPPLTRSPPLPPQNHTQTQTKPPIIVCPACIYIYQSEITHPRVFWSFLLSQSKDLLEYNILICFFIVNPLAATTYTLFFLSDFFLTTRALRQRSKSCLCNLGIAIGISPFFLFFSFRTFICLFCFFVPLFLLFFFGFFSLPFSLVFYFFFPYTWHPTCLLSH